MKQKTIALWMYRNEGGDIIQEKLKKLLEKENIIVINDFDIRECYCLNGRVYTDKGFDLSSVDIFYHMNADEQSPYQNDILRALELSGVKVINSWSSYNLARNKFWTNTILKKHGINVPPAVFVNAKQAVKLAKKLFKEWEKLVVKQLNNHGGKGIILFDNIEQFIDYIEYTNYEYYYIEQFIEFEDHDYRVEILDNQVVYGISREKKQHSYKTNVHVGGIIKPLDIQKDIEIIALQSLKILNINTSVIDIIRSKKNNEFYVLEINPIMGMFFQEFLCLHPKGSKKLNFSYDQHKLIKLSEYLIQLIS